MALTVESAAPGAHANSTILRTLTTLRSRLRRSRFHPRSWATSLQAARVLLKDYGHLKSVATDSAIDREGRPEPWYTYPAIDFITQLDLRDKVVFEYGAGMSTIFWAGIARRVVSVEDNDEWYEAVARDAPGNARVIFEPDLRRFAEAAVDTGETFDVIVVDGAARGGTRLRCCRAAVRALRPGGFIILDNADWLPESTRFLREQNLLQVDMTGFAPICGHVQTTSFFFDRAFQTLPLQGRLPNPGRGAKPYNWEATPPDVPGDAIECDGETFRGVSTIREWTFTTTDDERRFLGFVYIAPDRNSYIAIVEPERNRVTLSKYVPAAGRANDALDTELGRIAAMTWSEMTAFVNSSPLRRYRC
ncbi:MAG TPA: class I SAM-dependent methyltransferase [Vicinamibacterales bacterium]|nr:class I SAM-dependent methyltransferase [Vicinamibacterales bacterium]